jgi:phosphoribosylglycinamide formyltransferase 1
MKRKRVGVLISGRGSNMRALVEAARDPAYSADIAFVASNRSDAAGLAYAEEMGIPSITIDHKRFITRELFDAALNAELRKQKLDLICCAGFMRIMTPVLIRPWAGRMLNIHPSLLPAYPGLHTHERVLKDGAKVHGATVHFVTPELDGGPIIAQAQVPVLPNDTPELLADRVLSVEHKLYVKALALVASGEVHMNTSV